MVVEELKQRLGKWFIDEIGRIQSEWKIQFNELTSIRCVDDRRRKKNDGVNKTSMLETLAQLDHLRQTWLPIPNEYSALNQCDCHRCAMRCGFSLMFPVSATLCRAETNQETKSRTYYKENYFETNFTVDLSIAYHAGDWSPAHRPRSAADKHLLWIFRIRFWTQCGPGSWRCCQTISIHIIVF